MKILLILMILMLSGCAHINKDRDTFWGWGGVKIAPDGNVTEITSEPPIKLPSFGISK